jgi:uncharacterized membrane protein YedE/YeeE
MQSDKIEALKRQFEGEIVSRRSTSHRGWYTLAVYASIALYLLISGQAYAWHWVIGGAMGVVLQRSKFCFAASFRDPLLTGNTKLLRSILLAMMVMSVGFFVIQWPAMSISTTPLEEIPGQLKPAGIHTALGALLFGTGMVVAGGCASGTLMRIGEGFKLQLIGLLGFLIGTVLAAGHFRFWDEALIRKGQVLYLPRMIGPIPALLTTLALLGSIYLLLTNRKRERTRKGSS